jgi:hypothetical protein
MVEIGIWKPQWNVAGLMICTNCLCDGLFFYELDCHSFELHVEIVLYWDNTGQQLKLLIPLYVDFSTPYLIEISWTVF